MTTTVAMDGAIARMKMVLAFVKAKADISKSKA
jgi:hypothetical protein